jgi:hypothetical protein
VGHGRIGGLQQGAIHGRVGWQGAGRGRIGGQQQVGLDGRGGDNKQQCSQQYGSSMAGGQEQKCSILHLSWQEKKTLGQCTQGGENCGGECLLIKRRGSVHRGECLLLCSPLLA